MSALSVIIVSYNVKYYLEQCLRSVAKASSGMDIQVIVVDNDSSDASVEYLEPLFPKVRFIRAGGNLGFSKANNMAVREADGKYILFLNPDTVLAENVLADCLRFMENHPQAGAAGVRMLNHDGTFARESRRAIPTPFVSFCKLSGLCAMFPKSAVFGKYYLGHLDPYVESRIEVISGAFMLVRREVLERTGGFDERFFMYGEDVDLSYRILKEGYENWYVPVTIMHYKGESTNRTSYRYSRVFYNAMLLFYNKHFRHYSFLFGIAVHLTVWIKTLLTFIANNVSVHLSARRRHVSDCTLEWMYAGRSENRDAVAKLVGVASDALICTGMSLPEKDAGRDYTIYDSSAFTYSEILENMSANEGVSFMAVYYPESEMLVTGREVLRSDGRTA